MMVLYMIKNNDFSLNTLLKILIKYFCRKNFRFIQNEKMDNYADIN